MSRYLRLRAEQVRRTPVGVAGPVVLVVEVRLGWDSRRVLIAVSRRRISQSQRSASVRGSPRAILAMLAGVWYWIFELVCVSEEEMIFVDWIGDEMDGGL